LLEPFSNFLKPFSLPYPISSLISARHLFPSPAAAVGRSPLQPAKQPAVAQLLPTVAAAQHGLLAHFRRQPAFVAPL
jgi:hypothetical protein